MLQPLLILWNVKCKLITPSTSYFTHLIFRSTKDLANRIIV